MTSHIFQSPKRFHSDFRFSFLCFKECINLFVTQSIDSICTNIALRACQKGLKSRIFFFFVKNLLNVFALLERTFAMAGSRKRTHNKDKRHRQTVRSLTFNSGLQEAASIEPSDSGFILKRTASEMKYESETPSRTTCSLL